MSEDLKKRILEMSEENKNVLIHKPPGDNLFEQYMIDEIYRIVDRDKVDKKINDILK